VATLFAVIGPILCLEIGRKSRSTGILLLAVVFLVSALVLGIQREPNSFEAGLASLLILASVPLFFVFLRRLAGTLERPDLANRSRSLLGGLINWVAMYMGVEVLRFFVSGLLSKSTVDVVYGLTWGFLFVLCLPALFVRLLGLIRGFQAEIARRV
jgi:hypothetical protein